MSLLSNAMENCIMLDKRTLPDGRGGTTTTWVEGAEFQAAIVYDTSIEASIAEAQGVKSLYKIVTTKAVNLQYHDVLRRQSDSKIFRVTSDGDDSKTPRTAGLDMRVVKAEEYTLAGD